MAARREPHVLVFPFPAQGHMLPLLDLAGHISGSGAAVTVVVTPKNLPLLGPLLSRCPSITPLVVPFPATTSFPNGVENVKDLPSSYFLPMMHALSGLRDPILGWVRSTKSKPDAIIYDFFLGWTKQLAVEIGVPGIVFSPSAAVTISILNYLWREMPKRDDESNDRFPITFSKLPNSPTYPWYQLSSLYRGYVKGDPVSEFIKEGFLSNISSWGTVLNSFSALEEPYIDHLRRDLDHRRVWAVGPLSLPTGDSVQVADRGGTSTFPVENLLAWLDNCDDSSVVYVAFGSQEVLKPLQAAAIAASLEKSGVRFVWSLKSAAAIDGDITGGLLEGFEERMSDKGIVIRGWAPQVAILNHRAVGSFVTHCGWNSVLEGIAAGVVLLTWPMRADQFINARLLEENVGVAIRASEGPETVPDSDEFARVVSESVDKTRPERRNADELRKKALEAVKGGGSSYRDLDDLLEEIAKRMPQRRDL